MRAGGVTGRRGTRWLWGSARAACVAGLSARCCCQLSLLSVSPEPGPWTRSLSWGTSCFRRLCEDQPTKEGILPRFFSVLRDVPHIPPCTKTRRRWRKSLPHAASQLGDEPWLGPIHPWCDLGSADRGSLPAARRPPSPRASSPASEAPDAHFWGVFDPVLCGSCWPRPRCLWQGAVSLPALCPAPGGFPPCGFTGFLRFCLPLRLCSDPCPKPHLSDRFEILVTCSWSPRCVSWALRLPLSSSLESVQRARGRGYSSLSAFHFLSLCFSQPRIDEQPRR